jgi:hypothetical protein
LRHYPLGFPMRTARCFPCPATSEPRPEADEPPEVGAPATQLPRAVSLFVFVYSRESKAKSTQVARLVWEECLSKLKLQATAMVAAGATPFSPTDLLRPHPVRHVHMHGRGEATVAATGRAQVGGTPTVVAGTRGGARPRPPPSRVRGGAFVAAAGAHALGELVLLVLRFFYVAIVVYRCCHNVLDMLQSFVFRM